MKSGADFRKELEWRCSFPVDGRWGIPLVRKQELVAGKIELVAYPDTRLHDIPVNTVKGVHFFVDDPHFESAYTNYERLLPKLSQYRFLLTPDFSVYADMSPWMQLASVAKKPLVRSILAESGTNRVSDPQLGTAFDVRVQLRRS